MSDFAAIMSRTIANHPGTAGLQARTIDLANAQLAARWPDGCPTCDGRGCTYDLICDNCGGSASLPLGQTCNNHLAKPTPCDHAAAPTLGELLDTAAALHRLAREHGVTPAKLAAIGAEVWGADLDDQPTMVRLVLEQLRSVEP